MARGCKYIVHSLRTEGSGNIVHDAGIYDEDFPHHVAEGNYLMDRENRRRVEDRSPCRRAQSANAMKAKAGAMIRTGADKGNTLMGIHFLPRRACQISISLSFELQSGETTVDLRHYAGE